MASDLPLITIFFALLFLPNSTFSADASQSSPSPSPQLIPPGAISPPPMAPTPSPDSPPAPPPSRLIPDSPSPAPFPRHEDDDHEESPSPAPVEADQGEKTHLGDLDDSEGMSGGKKAGIAIGVIAGGCVVGMAAVVYKKRQRNIRRARYSYTDQRDFL